MDFLGLAQQFMSGASAQSPGLNNSLLGMLIRMVDHYPGGINAIIQQLQASGLGDQVQSWISTGQNKPISAEQIQQAIGPQLAKLAGQANIPPGLAAQGVAGGLPQLIDQMTPDGIMPQSEDAVAAALENLKRKIAA